MASFIKNSLIETNVIDKIFRYLGYIPIISSFSGKFRQYYGAIKAVSAVALPIFTLITASAAPVTVPGVIGILLYSGISDMVRGGVERIPVYGNVACIVYDLARLII